MSARIVPTIQEHKYQFVTKNNENSINHANREYLRDITPKKTNLVSMGVRSNYFGANGNDVNPGAIGKSPALKNFASNDITPKKSEIDKQRQMQKLKEYYEDKIQAAQRDYRIKIGDLEKKCKEELQEKNYWKQATLKAKHELQQKSSSAMLNLSAKPSYKEAKDDAQASLKIKKLEEEVRKLSRENIDLNNELIKIKEKNRSSESKLRITENSLKTAEYYIKDMKRKQSILRENPIPQQKIISPIVNFNASTSKSSSSHKSDRHHHSSHNKSSNIRPSSNHGDLKKELEYCKGMNDKMVEDIERTNEELMREKLRALNSKYAQYA